MPFTPYHFGPSGFIGLVFRRWLDIPVFILANVVIDVEVLFVGIFGFAPPYHRYFHTLLIGAVVGLLWGIAAYPLRPIFKSVMRTLLIPYKPTFLKMIISGILGVWLHVLIDGSYHPDARMFWPNESRGLWMIVMSHISKEQLRAICVVFMVAAIVPYAFAVISYLKTERPRNG